MNKTTRDLLLLAGLGFGAWYFYKTIFPQLLTAIQGSGTTPTLPTGSLPLPSANIAPVSYPSLATQQQTNSYAGTTTAATPLVLMSSANDTSPAGVTPDTGIPPLRLTPIL